MIVKALCITIPQKTKWEEYEKKMKEADANGTLLSFKVPTLPKDMKKMKRCYICYKGHIIGWNLIVGIQKKGDIKDVSTGETYDGNYIQRTGKFHYLKEQRECTPFRGYKYIEI